MNAKWLQRVGCVAVVATALGGVANAAEPVGAPPAGLLTLEEGFEIDVAGVADALGISADEARKRMNIQQHAGEISERIREQYAHRLAGVYIEHEPTSRLVVRLTGSAAERTTFHHFGADTLEVVYEVGADNTLADLQRRFDARVPDLAQVLSGWQGGYIDERTGEVVLHVLRSEVKTGQDAVALAMTRHFDAPTRIELLDEPTVDQAVFGSGWLDYLRGGTWFICTGAFVVEQPSTGRYGTLTSGHCQPDSGVFEYDGRDGAFHFINHVARVHNNVTDIGWATIGTNIGNVGPWFWGNSWRQLTGRRTRTATNAGDVICKYGRVGLYGCATVFSIAFNPGNSCGPSVPGSHPCASTYVGLNSPVNLCRGGDSGGPWFITSGTISLAAGVHKAGNPAAGLCAYVSTDYAYSHLALQLLY